MVMNISICSSGVLTVVKSKKSGSPTVVNSLIVSFPSIFHLLVRQTLIVGCLPTCPRLKLSTKATVTKTALISFQLLIGTFCISIIIR